MPEKFTTMTVGNYVFEFDFDIGELRIAWAGAQTFLNSDETEALGDFLVEVLSTRGYTPQVRPLTITSVEVKTGEQVYTGKNLDEAMAKLKGTWVEPDPFLPPD